MIPIRSTDIFIKCKRYLSIVWLPLVLTILLIGESYFFNHWLDIAPGLYFWRSVAATIGLSALVFFPVVFFTKKLSRCIYLMCVSVAIAFIFISQFLYYKYSGGFLQASVLGYAGQAADLSGTIKMLLSYKLLIFLTPPVVVFTDFLLFSFCQKHKKQELVILSAKEKILAGVLILLVAWGGYGMLLHSETAEWGNSSRLYNSNEMYDLSSLVGKINIVNYSLEDLVEYALQPQQASPQDISFLTSWSQTRILPPSGSDFGVLKGKNLIFIQVESLENWVIGYNINGQEVAPNLTALASQGAYFSNYYSQIGEGNTADAEFSVLNSLYPVPDTVAFISYPKHQYDALPSLLDSNGYTTAVLHGDVASFWNRANAYPALGYEDIISQEDYTIPRPVGFGNLGDNDFFQESLPKLEALPQPFMATLITLSTHTPFILPPDLETLKFPKDTTLTQTQQDYLQCVHYSDMALGKFIAGLKADGLYNNSLIVIYGDHNAFIGTPDSQTNHVPMIMLGDSSLLQGIDMTPASHIDIYPTVADLLGIHYPISVLGQDVFTTATPVVTQRAAGTGAIKFIISSNLKYTGSADEVFDQGTCTTWPAGTALPVSDCQSLYQGQINTTKASDIVVRYNLLSLLTPGNMSLQATTTISAKF